MTNQIELISESEKQTLEFAKIIANYLNKGDYIALIGDLGCGKTRFVKGIADYYHFPSENVRSPSFEIMTEYQADIKIYHVDFYRFDESTNKKLNQSIVDVLFYLEEKDDGIVLIEWADRCKDHLNDKTLYVEMKYLFDEASNSEFKRKITIHMDDKYWKNLYERLINEYTVD